MIVEISLRLFSFDYIYTLIMAQKNINIVITNRSFYMSNILP